MPFGGAFPAPAALVIAAGEVTGTLGRSLAADIVSPREGAEARRELPAPPTEEPTALFSATVRCREVEGAGCGRSPPATL